MNRFEFALAVALFVGLAFGTSSGQDSEQSPDRPQVPLLTTRSNLVLVPVLVKNKAGKIVFSLTSADFVLTDDGVPQSVRIEPDTDSEPLALAVIVQTGARGASHLDDYRNLGPLLEALIGNVTHRVAVVGFDSKPRLEQDFTPDTDMAVKKIAALQEGDRDAAILDALSFGIDMLRKQPPAYRRAVLLLSETADSGSATSLGDAVRAVQDTNTVIYSFGFSTTRAAVTHETSKLPAPGGGSPYSNEPYAPGGCMSQDPQADPDAHGSRRVQALDCASDLLPPLRLARIAFLAAKNGLKSNVPKSVAQLTGGKYFAFKDAKKLSRDLIAILNDMPNYYFLSFRPQSPHAGFHALELKIKDKPDYDLRARKGYWVDANTDTNNK